MLSADKRHPKRVLKAINTPRRDTAMTYAFSVDDVQHVAAATPSAPSPSSTTRSTSRTLSTSTPRAYTGPPDAVHNYGV
ncbi:MAG: hypothetical protein WA208_15250 [Thermoanaerobaculia bacterium]